MTITNIRTAALGLALALGATAPGFAQAATAATGGIVVVNVARVFEESAAGKYAIAQLRPQADQLQARARSFQEQFQKEDAALQQQAQAKTLAGPALQAKARDLQQREQTAQTELQTRQRTLQATNQSVQQQILDGMAPIVTAIMKERGAVVAIPTSATLQVSTSVDVTPDVLSRIDRALPRVNMTAPTAAAPAR